MDRLYSTQNFARPDIATEVQDLPKAEKGFVIWPNPVSETLKISSTLPLSRIVVYSMGGAKMKEMILPGMEGSSRDLYLGDLQRGNYIIKVIDKKGKAESRKIIKF